MASIFDRAKAAYKECIQLLTQMGNAYKQYYAKKGKQFDTRILLNQFDVLLQYSLLEVALADGQLAGEELTFIMDLSQYYPLPEFLKSCGYNNATWQVIYNTDEQKLKSIVAEIRDAVVEPSNDVINVFLSYNSSSDKYYVGFEDNIVLIIAAVCQADGDAKDIEVNHNCLIISVLEQIKSRLK